MNAVALAAREVAHLLLLVLTREVEPAHVGPGVDLALSQHDLVLSVGYGLPHRMLVVQGAVLVHVADLNGFSDAERAGLALHAAGDNPQERGLAGAVGADDADDGTRWHDKAQILEQQPVAERVGEAVGLKHHVAQARPRRDVDLQIILNALVLLAQQLLVVREPGLALGLARPGREADPLQLPLQGLAPPGYGFLFLFQARLLLFQPRRVVPLEGNALTPVEFQDPAGDVVQKIAVVGYGDDRARIALEVLLQPLHRLRIQVIGRLVQQQDVRFLDQQPAQRHAPALAPREHVDLRLRRRAAERVHRHLQLALELPAVAGLDLVLQFRLLLQQRIHLVRAHLLREPAADGLIFGQEPHHPGAALLHHLLDGLLGIHLRLLLQQPHGVALGKRDLSQMVLLHPGNDPQERALARAVEAEDPDLGAVEERQVDVLQHLPLGGMDLAHPDQREYDLSIVVAHEPSRGRVCKPRTATLLY